MKQFIRTTACAFALVIAVSSCKKDNIEQPPAEVNQNVQSVSLSISSNVDLNLIASAAEAKGLEYELSVSGSPIETFTFNNETKKLWHLGKLEVGKHRVNLHVDGPDGSSSRVFIRYDVSNGSTTHSLSPTPVIGNNLAFDLIVEP